jgi:hypothetical protein
MRLDENYFSGNQRRRQPESMNRAEPSNTVGSTEQHHQTYWVIVSTL